jgi:histidinol phosphatase-like enzyme
VDRIYWCPHHPEKGFPGERAELKIECECRKPKIGMIERAARELNLDLSKSWMIGDTTTDVQTARNAGLRSVLVRTGHGGKDGRHPVQADFVVDDLTGAVQRILHEFKISAGRK